MPTPLDYGAAGSPRNSPSLAAWAKATGDAVGNVDTAWKTFALLNGWVVYDGTYNPPRYRRLPGNIVQLQLMIKSGTTAIAGNLPAGYRPAYRIIYIGFCGNGAFRWDITPTGDISLSTGYSTDWCSMQANFYAEA